MITVPTGFSSGSGPADPVTAIATSTSSNVLAPCAMARAASAVTTSVTSANPSSLCFNSESYATSPPLTTADEPGSSVSRALTMPPVIDSAVPIVYPRSESSLQENPLDGLVIRSEDGVPQTGNAPPPPSAR